MIKRIVQAFIFWQMTRVRVRHSLALDFYKVAMDARDQTAALVAVKAIGRHRDALDKLHRQLKRWL